MGRASAAFGGVNTFPAGRRGRALTSGTSAIEGGRYAEDLQNFGVKGTPLALPCAFACGSLVVRGEILLRQHDVANPLIPI